MPTSCYFCQDDEMGLCNGKIGAIVGGRRVGGLMVEDGVTKRGCACGDGARGGGR